MKREIIEYLKFKKGMKDVSMLDSTFLDIDKNIKYIRKNEGESKSICIFMPKPSKYAGGVTDIIRLGTYLQEFGNTVKYVVYSTDDISDCDDIAFSLVSNFKGKFIRISEFENSDIAIATNWQSAYVMMRYIEKIDYPAYFVQDFEPFFMPVGDMYFLAQKTYQFGFHMITLGGWIKSVIDQNIPGNLVDAIDFPYEPKQYTLKEKEFDLRKKINICAYLKMDPRRAPFVAIKQLIYAQNRLEEQNIKLEISVFGLSKFLKVKGLKFLGKINHNELIKLYADSDFGLVPSFTNFSLVPYEMLSQGLPVIDYKYGTSKFFLPDGIIQIDVNVDSLYKTLMSFVKGEDKLEVIVKNAQKRILISSWELFSVRFAKLIGAKYKR